MDLANRIQSLRKTKGISQEELAETIGVSRQAVSKWESNQSTPDIDNIILMSDFFHVTTDYMLKGTEIITDEKQENKEITSKILYIASTAFVMIGLFCAFGSWYSQQTMESVWGSMIIQTVGITAYFIAKIISTDTLPFYVTWFNIMGIVFMPVSMFSGYVSIRLFKQGWISPYPIDRLHNLIFCLSYIFIGIVSYMILRKYIERQKIS